MRMAKQRSHSARRPARPITNEQAENEAIAEIEAMTPKELMQSLVDAGIYTPTFRLARAYRNEPERPARARAGRASRPITNEEAENRALARIEAMTPRQVRQSLVDAGIITPKTFRLTRKYRGPMLHATPLTAPAPAARSPRTNGRASTET